MAAAGPDFKTGFNEPGPGLQRRYRPTLAAIAGISLPAKASSKAGLSAKRWQAGAR